MQKKAEAKHNWHLAGLHVSNKIAVLFKRFLFFVLLTQAEKRALSRLKSLISAEVRKKNHLKSTGKKNRNFETSKPAVSLPIHISLNAANLLKVIKLFRDGLWNQWHIKQTIKPTDVKSYFYNFFLFTLTKFPFSVFQLHSFDFKPLATMF